MTEHLEGYVVDIACLRKYPAGEYAERARRHSKDCALMGHCVESGFGLVDDDGTVSLLDSAATVKVLDAVRGAPGEQGVRLRVTRRFDGEAAQTLEVSLA